MKEKGGVLSNAYRWLRGTNVVPGADPYVFRHPDKGSLVLVTSNYRSIKMREFDEPEDIENRKKGKLKTIWTPKLNNNHGYDIWAPEAHTFPGTHWDNKWYIPYTASDGELQNHRMYVLESESSDPLGKYKEKGHVFDETNNHYAIDMTYLQLNDELYAIYSGWEGPEEQFPQNLYIARMRNPWTMAGHRKLLKRPDFSWEQSEKPIVEGPQILKHAGRVFLFYSTDSSWTQAYKMGIMELTGDDPMGQSAWTRFEDPIFNKGGAGHASFIETDRGENIVFYHKKLSLDPGWSDRVLKQEEFFYDLATGVPIFTKEPERKAAPLPEISMPIAAGFPRVA